MTSRSLSKLDMERQGKDRGGVDGSPIPKAEEPLHETLLCQTLNLFVKGIALIRDGSKIFDANRAAIKRVLSFV